MPVVRQKKGPSLSSLLLEPIFMMQAAEYGSLDNLVSDRQTVAVLVGRNLVRHGLRQTGAQRRMGPSAVIVDGPIPNRHLQMALVEGNQEVQTFATKAAAQSFGYGVRLWGSHRRWQNPYPQMGKALVHRLREDAVPILDDEAVGVAARQRFPELLPCPVGWAVAWWWRIWRDPISTTRKT